MLPQVAMSIIQDFYGPQLAEYLRRNHIEIPPDAHVAFRIKPMNEKTGNKYWDQVCKLHNAYNRMIERIAHELEEQGYSVMWFEYDGVNFHRVT